ncbi:MAG: excalibur calcium-binding domain-containing protein [Gammaproteobacteria bacterium]|nr:excalibur calcium-binding domain-containing protein [Gammaproteobacteria bacterium]
MTSDGKVLYGIVPEGTICEKRLPIEGSVTVVPAKAISTSKSNNKRLGIFSCDGRRYCSQMNSRAEAEFFLKNCPNTQMDGDHDGVPCESDSRF